MSINRGMDKEVVVHIYNGILPRYKKEWIWLSSREVDELRACYTEWSKSEREKYINVYIYGIEKKGTEEPICREGRETDPEKDLWTKLGEGVVGWIENVALRYIQYSVWDRQLVESCCASGSPAWHSVMVEWGGMRAGLEGGSRGTGRIHIQFWFALLFGRNQHDV